MCPHDARADIVRAQTRIRTHLLGIAVADVRHRYAIGREARAVRDRAGRGDAVMRELANGLPVGASWLYASTVVVDRLEHDHAVRLAKMGLTWSHLTELSRARSRVSCELLAQAALAKQLDVKSLRTEVTVFLDGLESRPRQVRERA